MEGNVGRGRTTRKREQDEWRAIFVSLTMGNYVRIYLYITMYMDVKQLYSGMLNRRRNGEEGDKSLAGIMRCTMQFFFRNKILKILVVHARLPRDTFSSVMEVPQFK